MGQPIKLALREHSRRKVPVAERRYFECAVGRIEPYLIRFSEGQEPIPLCLQSVISNTGGADQAILARPRKGPPQEFLCNDASPAGTSSEADSDARTCTEQGADCPVAMATRLASLSQPAIPPTFGFAVVDASKPGHAPVLFHSEPRRISGCGDPGAGDGPPPRLLALDGGSEEQLRLQALEESIHANDRAVVLLAEVDPRRVLGVEKPGEAADSARASLRRRWSAILGVFSFRYGSDRGDVARFEEELQEKRWEVLRNWRAELRSLETTLEEKRDLQREQRNLEKAEAETGASAAPESTQEEETRGSDLEEAEKAVAEARENLAKAREKATQELRSRFQESLAMLDIIRQECRNTRQLQHFGRQILREISPGAFEAFTRDKLIAKIALLARSYYHSIWNATSEEEKVVLAQFAHEGLASPKNQERILDLMYRGLIVRDPVLRPMNESFALFIRQQVEKVKMVEWEAEEGTSAWSILRWLLPVPLLLLGGFLFVTQRDAVSSALGFLLAAASVAPTLVNLFGYFEQRRVRQAGTTEPAGAGS